MGRLLAPPWLAGALGALALALPSSAGAAAFLPPAGKAYWGGAGGYSGGDIADFARLSGKRPAVYQFFVGWGASGWLSERLDQAAAQGARAMLSIEPEGLSPGQIARGRGDRFLAALARLLSERGEITYLRPLSEMNNVDNAYSPRAPSGRSRGPDYRPAAFRAAWRRIVLAVRGGETAEIDRRLRALRQPPLESPVESLPRPKVAFLWVPLSFGNPETPANHPRHFWPGSRYVDWVGTTWYSRYRSSAAMERFYRYPRWRRKPFVFAEWGVWGRDEPSFVTQFFRFMRRHRRVRMAVYYQSALLRPEFRLSTHPRTRAALRREVRWSGLTGLAPELRTGR